MFCRVYALKKKEEIKIEEVFSFFILHSSLFTEKELRTQLSELRINYEYVGCGQPSSIQLGEE